MEHLLNFEKKKKNSIHDTFKLQTDYTQKYCTIYLFINMYLFIICLIFFKINVSRFYLWKSFIHFYQKY